MSKRDCALIIIIVFSIRLLIFVVATYNFDFNHNSHENILSIWHRWDGKQYERIATQAYDKVGLNEADHRFLSHFPPLYPALSKLIMFITGLSFKVSAILISLTTIVIASILLFNLTLQLYGTKRVAFQAILLLNLYPTAYFGQTSYTESLFILLIVACMYGARYNQNINLAWLYSGAAILTRTVGITSTLVPIAALYRSYRTGKLKIHYLYGAIFPALALLIILGYNWHYYGHPLTFILNYQTTNHSIKPASYPFYDLIKQVSFMVHNFPSFLKDDFFMFHQGWGAILSIFCIVTLLCGIKILPLEYHAFAWGYLVFIHNTTWAISMPRYLWVVIPVILVWANVKNVILITAIAVTSLALQIYFAIRFTSGNWGF